MTTAIIVYVVGSVLAYGLIMGLVKDKLSPVLGVSREDIVFTFIVSCFSWVAVVAALAVKLTTNAWEQNLSWQFKRSYPTEKSLSMGGEFYLREYIREHGEIQ